MNFRNWLRYLLASAAFLGGFIPQLSAQERKPHKYALLVGVKNYIPGELDNLNYTENDAEEMGQTLQGLGFDRVVILTQKRGADKPELSPTSDNIVEHLKSLIEDCKADDWIVVGFSGHGMQLKTEGKDEAYFCPADARPSKQKNLIRLSDVYKELADGPVGVRLLFVDACRNDPKGKGKAANAREFEPPAPPRGVMGLFSCSRQQKSFESDEFKHGIFFHYLIKGLKGSAANSSGEVTLSSLEEYLTDEVPRQVKKENSSLVKQVPSRAGDFSGKLVLVSLDANAEEQFRRGVRALLSAKNKQDRQLAFNCFRNATERGHAVAPQWLAHMYDNGYEVVPIDPSESLRLIRQSAAARYTPARFCLAEFTYEGSRGFEKDRSKGTQVFEVEQPELRRLAERDDAIAQHVFARANENGSGISKNQVEAVRWYRKAAEQGFASGQNRMGWMYEHGLGVPEDPTEALRWYRMAADQGHAGAQGNVGWIFDHGIGIAHDEVEAVRWYRKAAQQGDSVGQHNFGNALFEGRGVNQDEAEAVRLFRKAAEHDQLESQFALGQAYDSGRGVAQDTAEAIRWWRKAAEKGNANSQNNLGHAYEYGKGVTKDEAEGARWYQKAAEQGLAIAQANLGGCYWEGIGVQKDANLAVYWSRKAAAQGNKEGAQTARDNLRTWGYEP